MTKIKLCGLTRSCDIEEANRLKPDFIGFVFAKNSKRYVSPERAAILKRELDTKIAAVGVFVDEDPKTIASFISRGVIDIAQLHGNETQGYIRELQRLTGRPVIKAFRIKDEGDVAAAMNCCADFVLLDSGSGGTGSVFDWGLLQHFDRPYFLAGGLNKENGKRAVKALRPYALDVSSGIEAGGLKDRAKMEDFVNAVREEDYLYDCGGKDETI